MSETTEQHRQEADRRGAIACAVLTVSDTRTLENDRGGALVEDMLRASGHEVLERAIIRDEIAEIQTALRRLQSGGDIQAVILTGGTGIAPRDMTPDAVESLIDRRLDGFGELFRMLSWEEIGAAAMLSRAVGGVMGKMIVLAIPGSTAAVRLALDRLIVPELKHLVDHADR